MRRSTTEHVLGVFAYTYISVARLCYLVYIIHQNWPCSTEYSSWTNKRYVILLRRERESFILSLQITASTLSSCFLHEQPLLNTWTWPSPPISGLTSLFFLPPCHLAQKQGQACPWVLQRYAWNARGVEVHTGFTHLRWSLMWPTFQSNFIYSTVLCPDLSTFEV